MLSGHTELDDLVRWKYKVIGIACLPLSMVIVVGEPLMMKADFEGIFSVATHESGSSIAVKLL